MPLPASPVACGAGGAGGVAAPNTVADVAVPPLGLVTTSAAAAVAVPKVQDTVTEVADTTVAAPQVPSAVAATEAPDTKPVPVMVNATVVFAVAVAG